MVTNSPGIFNWNLTEFLVVWKHFMILSHKPVIHVYANWMSVLTFHVQPSTMHEYFDDLTHIVYRIMGDHWRLYIHFQIFQILLN